MSSRIPWRKLGTWILRLVPLMVAIYGVSLSLSDGRWLPAYFHHELILTLGFVFGLMLAFSSFRDRTAWAYSLLISIFVGLQVATRFIPITGFKAPELQRDLVLVMHTRLHTFLDLFMRWIQMYRVGDSIGVIAIGQFLLVLLMFNSTVWLLWWSYNKGHVLIAAIPLGIILAININRSNLGMAYLQLFILCVLIALVSSHFETIHNSWVIRKVDHPEGLGLEWGGSAVLISAVAITLAGIAPIIATPEGWDTIRDWLRQDEPASGMTRVQESHTSDDSISFRDPHTPQLTEIGAIPPLGSGIVMWVETSDPAPIPEGFTEPSFTPQHYWRSQIYADYTGKGWELVEELAFSFREASLTTLPSGRYDLHQIYHYTTPSTRPLYAVNAPYSIEIGDQTFDLSEENGIIPTAVGTAYAVNSWAASPTVSNLNSISSEIPAEIIEMYTKLPPGIPTRVYDLADLLTEDLTTQYEKAHSIEMYLRDHYPYNLQVDPPPGERDIVDYFLFDAEGGFCSYHSTAMVVMLRSIGIPARVVSGFAMGTYDPELDSYLVRERDSHAWVEVYFPEFGWVEFEPTPNREPFERAVDVSAELDNSLEIGRERLILNRGALVSVLGLIGVVLAIMALLVWFRVIRIQPVTTDGFGRVGQVYASMRLLLADAGYPGSSSTTPLEFLEQLRIQLTDQPLLIATLERATEAYTRVRYGEIQPSSQEEFAIDQLWVKGRRSWYRFRLQKRAVRAINAVRDKVTKSK